MKHLYALAGGPHKFYTPDVYAARRKHSAARDGGGIQREPDEGCVVHFIFSSKMK
jgi:hypothetical protein